MRRLLRAGVNVCLGTDSLASVTKTRRQQVELDMFSEMRVLADRQPWLSPQAILRMSTVNAACALGQGATLGQLAPRALADVIALRVAATPRTVWQNILEHKGPVAASMIGGNWAIAPS